jgi:hypothetical protein
MVTGDRWIIAGLFTPLDLAAAEEADKIRKG